MSHAAVSCWEAILGDSRLCSRRFIRRFVGWDDETVSVKSDMRAPKLHWLLVSMKHQVTTLIAAAEVLFNGLSTLRYRLGLR